jgi:polyisoprenoid-binding protein YceI
MKTRLLYTLFVFGFPFLLSAQQFLVEKSTVVFFSDAPLEDIRATNSKARAILDVSKAEVAFDVPIKDFEFEKDLMKQHFNEKYLETEKFPKSQFSGKLTGFDKGKKGEQQVVADGKLLIHGVTQAIKIPGTIELTPDNKAMIKAKFMVKVADYEITIPQLVFHNIAEEVEVTVEFLMKPK